MNIQDIRELPEAELVARIKDQKAELNKLRINHAVSAIESSAKIRGMRRDIARMSTVLNERKHTKQ